MVSRADQRTVTVGMDAVVRYRLDKAKEGSPRERVLKAYDMADQATERTQLNFNAMFRSGFSRGSALENILSTWGSATNTMLNVLKRQYRQSKRTGDWNVFWGMMFATLTVAYANTSVNGVSAWLRGKKPRMKER